MSDFAKEEKEVDAPIKLGFICGNSGEIELNDTLCNPDWVSIEWGKMSKTDAKKQVSYLDDLIATLENVKREIKQSMGF